MKKIICTLIFLIALCSARASDTLTIRQIYNFDVGDTFTYRIGTYNDQTGSSFGFTTVAISNKWFSSGLDSLFYSRTSGPYTDTIVFTRLDSMISLNDTPQYCHCYRQFTIDSACNTIRNTLNWGDGLFYSNAAYIMGLGEVQNGHGTDAGGIDTALNSYVKGGVYYQTPYYTTGLRDVSQNRPSAHLYPNPTTDILHVSLADASRYHARLIITDLLGQEVCSYPIADVGTTHDISKLPSGIYAWRLASDNGTIQTGKLIKQ